MVGTVLSAGDTKKHPSPCPQGASNGGGGETTQKEKKSLRGKGDDIHNGGMLEKTKKSEMNTAEEVKKGQNGGKDTTAAIICFE